MLATFVYFSAKFICCIEAEKALKEYPFMYENKNILHLKEEFNLYLN